MSRRDAVDYITLITGIIGTIVVSATLYDAISGEKQTQDDATSALNKINRLAIANEGQLAILKDNYAALEKTATANAAAARAATEAARAQTDALTLENRQMILTFHPFLVVKINKNITSTNIPIYSIEIDNKGTYSAMNYYWEYAVSTADNYRDLRDNEYLGPILSSENELCSKSEKEKSPSQTEFIPNDSIEISNAIGYDDVVRSLPHHNHYDGPKNIILYGCISYGGIDRSVIHHTRFLYTLDIGKDEPSDITYFNLKKQDSGNYSD